MGSLVPRGLALPCQGAFEHHELLRCEAHSSLARGITHRLIGAMRASSHPSGTAKLWPSLGLLGKVAIGRCVVLSLVPQLYREQRTGLRASCHAHQRVTLYHCIGVAAEPLLFKMRVQASLQGVVTSEKLFPGKSRFIENVRQLMGDVLLQLNLHPLIDLFLPCHMKMLLSQWLILLMLSHCGSSLKAQMILATNILQHFLEFLLL
mmetsp:Transcript_4237/g.11981  ORF Transcript_4237/g.11981 Transcript_4237/m.11981 type:complete len:206 (-) Transcript_4237:425-1042(-)